MSWKRNKKYIMLWIIELILILLLLPGCFGEEELIYSLLGEDSVGMSPSDTVNCEFSSDKIELKPGIYEIEVRTNLPQEATMSVKMESGTASFKAVRNNGAFLFGGQREDDFSVYILDKVPEAYINCRVDGAGADVLEGLELYKTRRGNRILLFGAIVIFGVLDFFILFRKSILEGKISRKQQIAFWGVAGGILLAYFPYLTDFLYLGDDGLFQLSRISFLKDTIRQNGTWPIWIQSSWAYGHGYATSLFYSDFFFLIPAFLQLLGFSLMSAYKIFIFIITAATGISAYYCLRKCTGDEYAALAGSLFYLLVPYRLFDIYGRGAIGEALAMVFLPLIGCGMYKLYTEEISEEKYRKYKWYIVWGMSAIVLSHLLTAVMSAVFMAITCAILWRRTFRRRTFMQLLEAVGLVLLISAWFWIPMIYMLSIDQYHVEALNVTFWAEHGNTVSRFFQMIPNTGGMETGEFSANPRHLGAGAFAAGLLYIVWRLKTGERNKECDVLMTLVVAACILSTEYLPWNTIMNIPIAGSIMGVVQFPYRWLSLGSVTMAMFLAFFLLRLKREKGTVKLCVNISMAIAIISGIYQVNDIAFMSTPTWLYNAENMGTVNVSTGEYLLEDTENIFDMYYHEPVAEGGLTYCNYEKNGTNITATIENRTDRECFIEFPLFGYRGYEVRGGKGEGMEPYISNVRGEHGDLRLSVPGGYQGTIEVFYKGFPIFYIAGLISVASIMVIAGWYVGKLRKSSMRHRNNIEG